MQDRDGEQGDRPRPVETARQGEIGDHEREDFRVMRRCAQSFIAAALAPRRGRRADRAPRPRNGEARRRRRRPPCRPSSSAAREIAASTRAGCAAKSRNSRCSRPAGLVSPPPARCSASRKAPRPRAAATASRSFRRRGAPGAGAGSRRRRARRRPSGRRAGSGRTARARRPPKRAPRRDRRSAVAPSAEAVEFRPSSSPRRLGAPRAGGRLARWKRAARSSVGVESSNCMARIVPDGGALSPLLAQYPPGLSGAINVR